MRNQSYIVSENLNILFQINKMDLKNLDMGLAKNWTIVKIKTHNRLHNRQGLCIIVNIYA